MPRAGSPGVSGRSGPTLMSLQPSCRNGYHSWVGMWHPEGMAPCFGGTRVLQGSCVGTRLCGWQGRG